jgi:uncharacterized membrane protein YqaE (UPF0057 family)
MRERTVEHISGLLVRLFNRLCWAKVFFYLNVNYMSILSIILAIFLPPLAVGLQKGLTGAFWINVLLTLIGFVPGIIHAFYVLSR